MSKLSYNGISIDILEPDEEESKKHIEHDFAVLVRENIEKIIKERFIPWIKGEDFPDKDDDLILEGLNIYYICYDYGKIIAEHSPTGKEDFFGHFEFEMESSNDYTADILEAVAMEVYVLGDEIVKVDGYDV